MQQLSINQETVLIIDKRRNHVATWKLFTNPESSSLDDNYGLSRSHEGPGFRARTLTDGKSAGVQMVTLSVGGLEVDLLPTRGMGIHQARRDGRVFGWQSPVTGPVHPALVPIDDSSGLGWLEGFDEMMVRCGMLNNGAPEFGPDGKLAYPVHGRVANTPARNVAVTSDDESGVISISATVEESRFLFHCLTLETTVQIQGNRITILDRVTNNSSRDSSFQMLYHNNFGVPLLSSGSQFIAPVAELAPRDAEAAGGIDSWDVFDRPTPGFAEQVFFMKLHSGVNGRSSAMLANRDDSTGVCVSYDGNALPWFTFWKHTSALEDGYVCGLEPGTNFPNGRSFEEQHDRVVFLAPGGAHVMELEIELLTSDVELDLANERITALQVLEPVVHRHPKPEWSGN